MIYTIEDIKEKLKYFDDPNFKFDHDSHTYKYEDKIMLGTTSYLNRFVKPFDEIYWSNKKAEDGNTTPELILEDWKNKRDRSCDLGHMVHEYIENFHISKTKKLTDDDEANERIKKFHEIYDSRLNVLTPVVSELKVFNKRWNLAGTIDQLYLYNGQLIMGDWKTNKKIKTDADYAFSKLLAPFSHLKDNEINKYSLQISIYRLMLEEIGLKCSYGFICHIPPKGEAKIYKLKDFTKELREYLDQIANTNISEFTLKPGESNIYTEIW